MVLAITASAVCVDNSRFQPQCVYAYPLLDPRPMPAFVTTLLQICKARARGFSVTPAELLWLDNKGKNT